MSTVQKVDGLISPLVFVEVSLAKTLNPKLHTMALPYVCEYMYVLMSRLGLCTDATAL